VASTDLSELLDAVAQARDIRDRAEHDLRAAIRAAHRAGGSLRVIAAEALLSHEQVRRVAAGGPPTER
jgi:hypothetical protein